MTDFRSYTDVDVPLKPGVTIFSGPNGEGKTNLVEAVGYAATLASHRAAQDAPLIRKGAEQAHPGSGFHKHQRRACGNRAERGPCQPGQAEQDTAGKAA